MKGLGAATLLLGPMVRTARAAAAGQSTTKVLFLTQANGADPSGWTPTGGETDFVLAPAMANLQPVRKDILILKNMTAKFRPGNAHLASRVAMLTGRPAADAATQMASGPSIDQVLADAFRGQTPFASLELGIKGDGFNYTTGANPVRMPAIGDAVTAYTKLVGSVMSGGQPTTPPDPSVAARRLAIRKSALDFGVQDIQTLQTRLGTIEKARLDGLVSAFRDYELSLSATLAPPSIGAGCQSRPAAPGGGLSTPALARAQLDNATIALACGLTRVVTVHWGGSQNGMGVDFTNPTTGDWHGTSHSKSPFNTAIHNWIAGDFAYVIGKVRAIGGQALLDDSVLVWTTQNGNSNAHTEINTPFVLAGRMGGRLRTGRLLDAGGQTQNNLYVSIANAMGVPLTTFGEPTWCTGRLTAIES
jgi:hypothetical protein